MRIGILADIHGDTLKLERAIKRFHRESVDRFVVLGDIICEPRNSIETIDLLLGCNAVGVWGNHELGLCTDQNDEIRVQFTDRVIEFFDTLESKLEFGNLLFSHTLPYQDPNDPLAYYLGQYPEEAGALDRCFSEFPHRVMMVGHFHRWFAATPSGRLKWNGESPLELAAGTRYFFIIDAVMNGRAAILDSEQNTLIPIQV